MQILLFNKPFDVHSQFRAIDGQHTLAGFIHEPALRLAGRLDRDSEGLLVLTDSGKLIHKITQPDQAVTKTYWVQVEGAPVDADLSPLREGIELKDGLCRPATCSIRTPSTLWPRDPPVRIRKHIPDTWLEITISEGRNRQVRRMFAAIGLPVLRLIRYRVGSWTIDGIAPGASCWIRND